ncbi:FAD-dependent oxidoreductase [Candidatus Pantoea persica]|uniref:FAD-dependent oxidoreductase n=1 Tax=Candidatus Pantoea persica TaxID=2518128 RepID=UPI00215D7C18|nr:FAD-dependent oxidoreductase [Candidatus Pantoea persica]MBA2814021.1 glycine oxidase ThiO [Candidatus Pantoea persica]
MSHWSVIGSGVAGLCVATLLAEQDESVEVILSDETPASHWAGGMLAPFCEGESAPPTVVELGMDAAEWWAQRVEGVVRQGTLVVAPPRDAAELTRFARMTRAHQWADPASLEPALAGRFARGLFFPGEAHLVDPREALRQLRASLTARGVVFHHGKPGGRIIDCRGIHAADRQPDLRAVRGEMAILHSPDLHFSRPIRLLHPRFPCYLVPRAGGRFMLGATMVESDDSSPISARALMELLGAAWAIHPALAEARIVETGTGRRPAWPLNVPEVRYRDGVFSVNGMYRHGFLLAPAMAQQLIQQISEESNHAN